MKALMETMKPPTMEPMTKLFSALVFCLVISCLIMPKVVGEPEDKSRCEAMKKEKPNINRDAPEGWFLAGTHPFEYEAKLDKNKFHSGTQSCRVEFIGEKPSGWTTLMQNMSPSPYSGKRLRMKFWLRTKKASGYASGWMRVDGEKGDILSFENMCNRKLVGTNNWTEQEIVLDIPEESTNIGFGIIFEGSGKVWVDDISFETVSKKVSTTTCPCSPSTRKAKKPVNLNFEDGGEE